ncbi:MAG: hypothetical protein HY923_05425 [Elusimicrobia bacterium]|nr:hypothetical protein [Elusimicrobiota bacterium]
MGIQRLLIGAFLLAALPAAAQRAVLPVAGLSRSGPVAPLVTLPGAPALAAPALSAPSLLPSLMPSAPAIAPVPVVAPSVLKLPAVAAAVAQFQTINLSAAPAAEARGAADELMARALGAEAAEAPVLAGGGLSAADLPFPPAAPDAARTPVSGSRVHLLSKPLHATVELGPVARVLHYALETAFQFVKAGVVWHASGSVTAGLGVLAFEIVKLPPMITAQSLMDLGLRYWWRKLSTLRELAKTPGVSRIRVLTTGEAQFSGILARKQENTGLVFMDAKQPLPAEIKGFGAPIPVADLGERRVRLALEHDDRTELTFWEPSLGDLLSGKTMPAAIAESWRARLDADKKDKTPLQRVFDFSKEKELKVEAHLSDGDGGEVYLGTIAFGRSVKRLVGIGRWDRIMALFGAQPEARAIPISDTAVERGGMRGGGGFWRRGWLRLTGRLIVRP